MISFNNISFLFCKVFKKSRFIFLQLLLVCNMKSMLIKYVIKTCKKFDNKKKKKKKIVFKNVVNKMFVAKIVWSKFLIPFHEIANVFNCTENDAYSIAIKSFYTRLLYHITWYMHHFLQEFKHSTDATRVDTITKMYYVFVV